MRPAFMWNPELRESLPNLSGVADSLESAALQAAHGELPSKPKRDPLRNRLKAPKAPRFDDTPEITTSETFSGAPSLIEEGAADGSDLFSDEFFSQPPPMIAAPPLLPAVPPPPMIVTPQVPITPVPIIPLVPIAQAAPRSIPKPPRPFDLELGPDVLVEINEPEAYDPGEYDELEATPLRSSAPPVVRSSMQPTHARLARGVMAATGAAAGAILAFALAPSQGSASVPLSRALTTPVVVFTLEKAETAPIEHRIDAPVVLDLDADRPAAVDTGAAAPAALVKPMKRKRPRVVIEHAPYRSIPVRPGEQVASYPIDHPTQIEPAPSAAPQPE